MKRTWIAVAWAMAACTIVSACTATSTVDLARLTRDRDDYKAARDVATEFIDKENSTKSTDTEKFVKDTLTLDAATGTLMIDAGAGVGMNGTVYEASVKTADGFRAILERDSYGSHGYTSSLSPVGPFVGEMRTPTVREHMRQHVYEWDVWVKTGTEMRAGMTQMASDAWRYEVGGDLYKYTYLGSKASTTTSTTTSTTSTSSTSTTSTTSTSGTTTEPAPEPVAEPTSEPVAEPTPEPEPLPLLHRAG